MYSILGWLNAVLLTLMVMPFALIRANKMIFKGKNKNIQSLTRMLRKIHKQMGFVLVVTGIVHGYLALGGLRLHTGTLLYLSLLLTGTMGLLFYLKKKKIFLQLHRYFAALVIMLLALHLIFPSALNYFLR
ncbi:hypothetical protein [Proteocatella sphenisci]|uniref:hypothetical protein n=1 Tax=Proteocatella sphenisci TaxID=181070 RepID=UPI0004B978FF|nr:hypothetical protein [Proteocatella sphenisci]